MKKISIKEKLAQLDVPLESIVLGDFDYIGELSAKRSRSPGDPNYKKVGATYRSNYERGILLYYLIRKLNCKSMLEIGFGRGYSSLCAAKAFYDAGIDGKIVTIDPKFDRRTLDILGQVFGDLMKYVTFVEGPSQEALKDITADFDLVYIDGDHSYEATKSDWMMTRDKFNKCLLFDDYHLPDKDDAGIKCAMAIDEIDHTEVGCSEPELIIMDRRIFFDDRRLTDDQVNYGQVLLTKSSLSQSEW